MRKSFAAALSLSVTVALAGAAHAQAVEKGALTLSDLQVRATPPGVPTTAAYLTISNGGKAPDKLLSIDCACAASTMMHESQTVNGISSMSRVSEVAIPADGKVEFKPGGLHVMLVGLKAPLKAGGMQDMTLRFEKAGVVKVGFPVRAVIK